MFNFAIAALMEIDQFFIMCFNFDKKEFKKSNILLNDYVVIVV